MLTAIAPDLHTSVSDLRLPGGVRLPCRMTVAKLPDGGLVVHSPIAATPELCAAVAALGPVKHILAPSLSHHLHVGAWLARFPGATAHGVPGLRKKRPDIAWGPELNGGAAPWASALRPIAIAGAPRLGEYAFVHDASRSLIVTDLLFHLVGPLNFATRMLVTLTGTRGHLAMSRVWRLVTRDKAALAASVTEVLAQDFVRILPAHGAVFSAPDAPARARAAMAWAVAG